MAARAPRALFAYVFANYVLIIAATFALLMWGGGLPWLQLAALAGLIVLSLTAFGGLMESKGWALPVELVRLALVAGGVVLFFWDDARLPLAAAMATAAGAGSALWVLRTRPARAQPAQA
ncbi:MAG: hypothetical protein ACYC8T_06040 [Myxococcaceae bacterium]